MSSFFPLVAVAILIEGLISYGQQIYKNGSIQWQIVVALILSGLLCYDMSLNFFVMLGFIEQWPIIGVIATAIILSRGSNYMFELYGQLTSWRQFQQNNNVEED